MLLLHASLQPQASVATKVAIQRPLSALSPAQAQCEALAALVPGTKIETTCSTAVIGPDGSILYTEQVREGVGYRGVGDGSVKEGGGREEGGGVTLAVLVKLHLPIWCHLLPGSEEGVTRCCFLTRINQAPSPSVP
jgi:hypothetical protein